MINIFMKDPLANSYAVVILIALVVCWITSLAIILKDSNVDPAKSWHNKLLPVLALVSEIRMKNRLARTLLETYVGSHASELILAGAGGVP